MEIKVFKYIPELDAFLVTEEFSDIVRTLGLSEWNDVVFIGRYFMLDNDYGEHWFDNWYERDDLAEKAESLGLDGENLMIVSPERMQNGHDGPCHSPQMRKMFWTDVLKSLTLSLEFLFDECRRQHCKRKFVRPDDEKIDPVEVIAKVKAKYER